jgi:hypothetical protein
MLASKDRPNFIARARCGTLLSRGIVLVFWFCTCHVNYLFVFWQSEHFERGRVCAPGGESTSVLPKGL